MTMTIPDAKARAAALDIRHSCIVQAPAGSGKTELLTQRYLRLLSVVNHPEEIVAITFTRKAANEMRERILERLNQDNPCQTTLSALAADKIHGWRIRTNPQRLRILTIDAFSASITRAMPLLSQFGHQPEICADPGPLYLQAATALIGQDMPWHESLKTLLDHLDNQPDRLIQLLTSALAGRDQWLDILMKARHLPSLREYLEQGLYDYAEQRIQALETLLPQVWADELSACVNFALEFARPAYSAEHLAQWHQVCQLLLTNDGNIRKTVNKNQGFPAEQKPMKARMLALLNDMRDDEALTDCLRQIAMAPPTTYTEQQWQVLTALIELLPLSYAQLKLQFSQRGEVDFIEIACNSLIALGEIDSPSELALRLDYQISHLLIDEFQDTSHTQFHLLEKLTAGWEMHDGRTLFLVGDPMQSIYRFRQADVGLFLQAQHKGIHDLTLEQIHLTTNFRANSGIVNWLNQVMPHCFPKADDIPKGAIQYTPATPIKTDTHTQIETLLAVDDTQEVAAIIERIQNKPPGTLAILVKARRHLNALMPELIANDIPFLALDLDSLAQRPVVQDCYALTRALLHLGDRLAWLGVLRAPWCGLNLADCTGLTDNDNACIWESLHNESIVATLSADGQQRLNVILPVLTRSLAQRLRLSTSIWVQQTWIALEGPACLKNASESDDANAYWAFLSEQTHDGPITDFDKFEQSLNKLYAKTAQQCDIQIMTIHKSKGLEFDTVILPRLEKSTHATDTNLLRWDIRQNQYYQEQLLLAPIKSQEQKQCPTYECLKREDQEKNQLETMRLLYVALTRAKSTLILTASTNGIEPDAFSPRASSFLHHLWPACRQAFISHTRPESKNSSGTISTFPGMSRRPLKAFKSKAWDLAHLAGPSESINLNRAESVHTVEQIQGTFIHELIHDLHTIDLKKWSLEALHPASWPRRLITLGHTPSLIQASLAHIQTEITTLMQTENFRALFQYSETAVAEFSISDRFGQHIVDRSFIDKHQQRWIIDFKTTQLLKTPTQEHYRQLERYARLFQALGPQPIICGVYFTWTKQWHQWQYGQKEGAYVE